MERDHSGDLSLHGRIILKCTVSENRMRGIGLDSHSSVLGVVVDFSGQGDEP
jgi:hypothetical protein